MKIFDLFNDSHRRYNPLNNQWVLVSPQRSKRPWMGIKESFSLDKEKKSSYDDLCFLCPENKHANGKKNLYYYQTFVFTNDFSLFHNNHKKIYKNNKNILMRYEKVQGTSRVIYFSPHHSIFFPNIALTNIVSIIQTWIEQINELSKKYCWIQIFENKGISMGCSSPHPYGQIWAHNFLPQKIKCEHIAQYKHFFKNQSPLLLDYKNYELKEKIRIVIDSEHWLVVVPWWASWPFETFILPKQHTNRLKDLNFLQIRDLSKVLKKLTIKYDNLFNCSFPYSMGWHGAPFNDGNKNFWHLHAHFYPPLLRSQKIKKFMFGYEMLAEIQRDLTPEKAAYHLNAVSDYMHLSEIKS